MNHFCVSQWRQFLRHTAEKTSMIRGLQQSSKCLGPGDGHRMEVEWNGKNKKEQGSESVVRI